MRRIFRLLERNAKRDHGANELKIPEDHSKARPSEWNRGRRRREKSPPKVNHPDRKGNRHPANSSPPKSYTRKVWSYWQAVPRTLHRAFSRPISGTMMTDRRRIRPVGGSLTARADQNSRTIRSRFFKSDSSVFWPKSEATIAPPTRSLKSWSRGLGWSTLCK